VTRTPRRPRGVHHHEMRRNHPTDELDQVLAGGDDPLASILSDLQLRAEATEAPAPGEALSAVLGGGLRGRAPLVAAPAPAARRAPRRRRLVTVAGIGARVLTGTGVAGALPEPAQRPFDRVADAVGFDWRPSLPADPVVVVPEPAPLVDQDPPGEGAGMPTVALERWGSVPWPGTVPPPASAADDGTRVPGHLPPPAAGHGDGPAPETAPPPVAPADRPTAPTPAPPVAPAEEHRPSAPADQSTPETEPQARPDTSPSTTRTPPEAGRRSP
jgi:hypothetical protein